jgi:hypothetical protein
MFKTNIQYRGNLRMEYYIYIYIYISMIKKRFFLVMDIYIIISVRTVLFYKVADNFRIMISKVIYYM